MAHKLKFGNGTWATKKGSTLAYNDENDNYKPLPFTTTRESRATRVNKEGLIEVVGNDIPRIDYTDNADGALLLENSTTNLIPYSEDFTKLTKTNTIITSNQAVSPDGTLNADELTGSGFARAIYAIGNGDITVSCYVKSNDGSDKDFTMGAGSLGSIGNSKFTATSEWKRFTHTFSTTAQSTDFGFFATGGTSLGLYLFGFQLEQGSYPTSYIPTSGSSATRQADTANGSGNSEVFNDSEGVLFAEISAENNSEYKSISLSNASTSGDDNRVLIALQNSNLNANVRVGNVYQFNENFTLSTENFSKIALKYKTNNFSLWVNGFEVAVDNNGVTFSNGVLLKMQFADGRPTTSPFYGKTKELGYYDTALTDEELEYLTSYRSLNELVTELNLNTL